MALIKYPSTLKTDSLKLNAVYSLIEQARLHHNVEGERARQDWSKHSAQWYNYALKPNSLGGNAFWGVVLPLFTEQNRLQLAVRRAVVPDREFKRLSVDDKCNLHEGLFKWDTEAEALYPQLDRLKVVDFRALTADMPPDPLEDYGTYSEVDEDGDIAVSTNSIVVTTMRRDALSYVVKDFTASYFNGNWEHLLKIVFSYALAYTSPLGIFWAICNVAAPTHTSISADGSGLSLYLYSSDGVNAQLRMREFSNVTTDTYVMGAISALPHTRYCTVARDSTTATNKIYSDEARTNLQATLSLAIPTTAFRYLAAMASMDNDNLGDQQIGFTVSDLDIGLTAAPTVTTQAVTDIAKNTATANGNVTDAEGLDITERGFDYGTETGVYPDEETESGTFGEGAFALGLTGLTPGQTYYVRAKAYNSDGWGYGSEVSFDALDPTSSTVTTQAVSAISSNTATANGNITDDGGLTITKRGFYYSEFNPIPTSANSTEEEEGSFGEGAFTGSLTGLSRNTKYYIRAFAYSTEGYSYGSVVNFTTLRASSTLATAQVSVARTPYIKMVFTSYDGNTTYDLSFDSSAYGKRIILIDHYEEPYNDYAIVVLRNHDLALPTNLVGYWVEIGYGDVTGSGNEYELTPRLWVKHHQIVSAAGKLVMLLELEGTWAKMRETKLRIGNPPYYTVTYSIDTVLDIITTIMAELDPVVSMLPLAEDDGIMDTLTPVFELNTIQPFEDAGSSIYRLMKMTKSFLRHKAGLVAEIKYPQATDVADFAFYSSAQATFREYTNRKNLIVPNHIYLFANAGVDNLWTDIITAEAVNQDSIDAYGDVPDIVLAPEIDNQTDADNRAEAVVARIRAEENAGSVEIKHDCRVELYDRIGIADSRGL